MFHQDDPEMQPEAPTEPSLDDVLDAALTEPKTEPDPAAAEESAVEADAEAEDSAHVAGLEVDGLDFLPPGAEQEVEEEEIAEPPAEPEPDPEIERLGRENAELKDRFIRAMAELENVRKRSRRELETSTNLAKANVLRELLEVADNFGRALGQASFEADEAQSSFAEGVRLIYVQFMEILRQNGCERIPAKGQPFDPNLHEAISQIETDEVPSQHVVEVVQEGYSLNDTVLRPARVVVAS